MSDSESAIGPLPPKRPNLNCLIHCTNEVEDTHLVSLKSVESWRTLVSAAEVREHDVILKIASETPDGQIPKVQYHRKCRSIFTMKKVLSSIREKKKPTNDDSAPSRQLPVRKKASSSRVYDAVCIFCQKVRYLKCHNSREPLIQCCETRANDTIRRVAIRRMDTRIMAIVSRNIVAAEAHYHRTCYRIYTKDEGTCSNISANEDDNSNDAESYQAAEINSYKELFSFIREDLLLNPHVIRMSDLTSRLVSSMKSLSVQEVKDSTKKHIRRKLETEFPDVLHIFPDDNGKLLLYPNSLSMYELAKENMLLKQELETFKCANTSDVAKCAILMRTDIKTMKIEQTWPPTVPESFEENQFLPDSVTRFLYTIFTGSTTCKNASPRIQRLVASLGQDLVYSVTNGKVKPPKHILLPFAVKSLTGNVELITTLNRLGHGISYSTLEEIDTALCLQKLSVPGNVALPVNINPCILTTLAWDNIDRLEETLSGKGTSHRVNGIAIQQKSIGPHLPRLSAPIVKTKQRSISAQPLVLPTYNVGKRDGPSQIQCVDMDASVEMKLASLKNMVWILARLHYTENQSISSWTGFNILTRDDNVVVQDNVGYLPTINAPATEMCTVYEVLNASISIMNSLLLTTIVCVFDQALYARAAEITWKHPDRFKNIILRMGAFHTICTFLAIIGKRFQDAGLRDLCIESGVVGEGSIAGAMEGRKYNRAVRCHKLLYEAFMRLIWKGFLLWLEDNHTDSNSQVNNMLENVNNLCQDVCSSTFGEILNSDASFQVMKLFEIYREHLRTGNGSLSGFWMSYVDMVETLLDMIRSSREGDWKLHLASIRAIIPWCFAYDRLNYARYLPYYYAQMTNLPKDHMDVYDYFMQGGFSVQLGNHNPFGRIPVDQTIEETVNKDTQIPGGTKGFSLKAGAVSKYYLTSEYRSSYLRKLRDMLGQNSTRLAHPDLHQPRINKDEADVQSLVDLMENTWLNPMDHENCELLSLSTGVVAPADIARDILTAYTVGEQAYENFRKNRLEEILPGSSFLDRMTKQNLKTFSNLKTKKTVTTSGLKQVVLKADRNLFGHMVLIAQSRQLDMRDVLSHPLGPLPWSLANGDGSLRKTNKAALARELEKNVNPVEEIPGYFTCIIDGMSIVQKMKGNEKTFGEIADSILFRVLHESGTSQRIDVVFDVYRTTSIKNAERCNRGSSSSLQFKNISPMHNIQQWRKFLCNSVNKSALIKFLVEQWRLVKYMFRLQNKVLYVTCEEKCYKITKDDWEEVVELRSTQEEADTRILLHAMHAAETGFQAVVISTEDTDVLVICLAFACKISCPLYVKCGTQNRTRFIDVGHVVETFGSAVCDALIGLHAFTGCDTVSAFAGRGKIKVFNQMRKHGTYQKAFSELGKTWEVTTELFDQIQQFTCRMYAQSTKTNDVNELRYQLFCAKRGELESSQLPPCKDCLHMHILRANYQAAIWRRCLETQPYEPNPIQSGWKVDDTGVLIIEWMRVPAAPEAVLGLLSCNCSRSCKLPDCSCLCNNLPCTDMCTAKNCSNKKAIPTESEIEVELGDSEEDDDASENNFD